MKVGARISDSTAAGPPAPTYDNLPDFPALARLKRDRKWVAWKYVPREGKPKPDKLPVNPYSGGNAMVDTPTTWGTYDQAVVRARRDKLPGVGYVLTDDDKLTGVDLDQVRNVETGKLTPWAAEIVALAESYTEVSPSGTGLRIFSEGKIDAPIVNDPLSVEIYRKGRFLTITGQHLKGTPTDILPAPKTEAALRARVNGANVKPPPKFKNDHGKFDHEPSEWQKLNTAALQNLSAWVPEIFGDKAKYRSGIYRISSKALGRNLQEALSISPKGIKDFGVHDIGDPREGKRSPIDIVMKYGGKDFGEAVEWLREKLGRDKKSKSIHATPFEWIEPSKIPPRQWLYKPHYIRQFVSATFSPGGLGKTSLLTVEALAMATNKPLLGIQPSQQLCVWYWNGEDPMQELQRRFAAACKYHGVTKDDIGDHLFIDSGRTMPIVIAEDTRTGTRIAEPVIEEVIATIRERQIDVLIVDPFISCHRVNENDNAAIERVAKSWGQISEVTNCSISLAHHVRKGKAGEAVTVEDGRGASALRDAVRTARTLNNMSAREAEDAEINESARLFYFRVDIGKRNLTKPAEKVDWFKLESVDLGNGPHFGGIGGDEVGVVTAWAYPKVDAPVITANDIERGQEAIKAGRWRADQRAKREPWVGIPIAQALGLDLRSKGDKRAVVKLVDGWLRAGFLKRVVRQDKDSRFEAVAYIEAGAKPPNETPTEAPEPGVDGPRGAGNA